MASHGKEKDIDPEVAARLAKIRNRDIGKMQQEYMDRYTNCSLLFFISLT